MKRRLKSPLGTLPPKVDGKKTFYQNQLSKIDREGEDYTEDTNIKGGG